MKELLVKVPDVENDVFSNKVDRVVANNTQKIIRNVYIIVWKKNQ